MLEADLEPVTRILLVEDNPIDIRLMLLAFKKERGWRTSVTVAEDGDKAIEYLAQELYRGRKTHFVILDLNLPKRDGKEVLRWIRQTEAVQDLPVAILSSAPTHLICDQLGTEKVSAAGYFTKPIEVERFWGLTKTLHRYFQNALGARCSAPGDDLPESL